MSGTRSPSPASALPAVNRVLGDPLLVELPRPALLLAARAVLAEQRRALLAGASAPSLPAIVAMVRDRVLSATEPSLLHVINASGVVLHTNLGRAPLASSAVDAVLQAACGYCSVEMDLSTGKRGERLTRVRQLLRELSGAEDALAVNNNAAAVMLALTALARDREVIVSRGEAVEIGGSFRIPEVITGGGARLVEVGCTNRTRVEDYARAIGPETAVILRVHRSNFKVSGFVASPTVRDLAELAAARGLLLIEDLGSGNLVAGLRGEPTVREIVQAGAHLVCFSGDKLLGGPQAGLIVGKGELISRLRRHPFYRALRMDKLGIAALEATLRLHVSGRSQDVPAVAMLTHPVAELRQRAERLRLAIAEFWAQVTLVRTIGRSGGGALPEHPLPGWAVALNGLPNDTLAELLRAGSPPVVGRIHRDALLLDPRTVLDGQTEPLLGALEGAIRGLLAGGFEPEAANSRVPSKETRP